MRVNKRIFKLVAFLIFCFSQFITVAQITFINKTDELILSSGTSGVALAVIDMNDDGLDDIVRLNNANDLYVEYQVFIILFYIINIVFHNAYASKKYILLSFSK